MRPTVSRPVTDGHSWLESPKESLSGEIPNPKAILGLARMGLLILPSPELLGVERSGERRTDTALATSVPWHPALEELEDWERSRGDSGLTPWKQTSPLPPGRTFAIWTSRASAPASIGCLLPYWCILPSAKSRICCASLNRGRELGLGIVSI